VKGILFSIAALAWLGAAQAQAPTPVGVWTTFSDSTGKPEGRVRIEERDGEFSGIVTEVFSKTNPNPVCDLCEGALKNKPVIGMLILRGLRADGDGYGGGTILDPDDGRTYRCAMTLRDDGLRLEIRGYIGFPWLGRTQVWMRGK